MFEEWLLVILIVIIVLAFIMIGGRAPKRCDNCTYFNGNGCDRCYNDVTSDVND